MMLLQLESLHLILGEAGMMLINFVKLSQCDVCSPGTSPSVSPRTPSVSPRTSQ